MTENEYHILKDPDFPQREYETRYQNARALMEKQNLDAIIIMEEVNLAYFSGFRKILPLGSKVRTYMLRFFILPRDGTPILIIPLEMRGNADSMTWIDDIRFFQSEIVYLPVIDPITVLLETLEELKLTNGPIGFEFGEGTRLECSHQDFEMIKRGLANAQLVDAAPLIWALRSVKSPAELDYLQRACNITQQAIQTGFEFMYAGMTEIELLSTLYRAYIDEGATDLPLKVSYVVESGPERHMMYDTRASTKKMRKGDIVIIDGGVSFKGYWADMTRLACIGNPSSNQMEKYNIALSALNAAMSTVKLGVTISDVAKAAAEVFNEFGYEKNSPYNSIGHGVGLEIHEPPFISQTNSLKLMEGNVLALEPIIFDTVSLSYMEEGIARGEGTGDFFIEDNIIVTSNGYRNLTPMEHAL